MTQTQALELLKTGVNVFLTGEPGSGKTHTINEYIRYLRRTGVEPAITASTGIAATHIGGLTIHSWSGIGIKESLNKYELDRISSIERIVDRVQNTHVLIIDEVSMLSSNTLSMIDAVCKEIRRDESPFGGMQIILVGDFFQLPPITRMDNNRNSQKNFAYASSSWIDANFAICYLTEQHRQDDTIFLSVLSAIRRQTFGEDEYAHIEKRLTQRALVPQGIPQLYTHNIEVDRINNEKLQKLEGAEQTFEMSHKGRAQLVETLIKGCLSPKTLVLKTGAVVMFTKNNPRTGFVNGTLGTVIKFDENRYPIVETHEGRKITVLPMDWNLEENGQVKASITQLPLRLAWAITIHKSQGMSMDAAAMDLSSVFEFGQGYVALSRVRRISGLHLFGINAKAFEVHPEILTQDQIFRSASENAEVTLDGIPQIELNQMQNNFIRSIGGDPASLKSIDEISRPKEKKDTYAETLILWNEGKSAEDIAEARELKTATILSHIEMLTAEGKINRHDLSRLLTPDLERALEEIHAAFEELSVDKLSPIFQKFDGEYSYDQLRIARILFTQR